MEIAYYDLSGGINQALTKTELGLDTKKIYWADAENIEILQNRGIIKQNGNTEFLKLPVEEKITGLCEMKKGNVYNLVITTISGKLYIYTPQGSKLTELSKTLNGEHPVFANFLDGVLVSSKSDSLFYIKNNQNFDIVECGLKDSEDNPVYSEVLSIYNGRVWVACLLYTYDAADD